jgi:hypothetical protein
MTALAAKREDVTGSSACTRTTAGLGFHIRELRPDGTPKTGPVALDVLAAHGYAAGSPLLWKLAAMPTVTKDDWLEFLDGLDGAPQRVVTDGHDGTIKAAMELWPDAAHCRSEWHLRPAFYSSGRTTTKTSPDAESSSIARWSLLSPDAFTDYRENRIHATLITFGRPCPSAICSGWPAATAWTSRTRGAATSTSASG